VLTEASLSSTKRLISTKLDHRGADVAKAEIADDRLNRVFGALADPTRRDIVARLTDGDATVSELGSAYDVSLQAVSKHLKVLEDAGLVSRSRDAQRRPVHLEAEVFDLMTAWIERYRQQAEERFRRLDELLAESDEQRGVS
jgi:DNA-binding transcriptional ArsR family regulator